MAKDIPENAYAMIIGAMKCGTNPLFDYLCGHPEVCPSVIKEPEFFSENQGRGVYADNYNDVFTFDITSHKVALEASTGYTKYPEEKDVAKRIFEYGITPKIIYCVRDPFDRIESQYNYWSDYRDTGTEITNDNIVQLSNYYLQLEQFHQYFPEENILIIDFDDVKNKPREVLLRAYDHLNLSINYFPASYDIKNKTVAPMSLTEKRVREISIIRKVIMLAPEKPKKYIKPILKKIIPRKKKVLTKRERVYIYNILKNDMNLFQTKYGFNIDKWGFRG